MYIGSDDAKTDVILAGATTVFGSAARGFVTTLPFYPGAGVLTAILDVFWILALTALVPVLLARHRGDGVSAFGLGRPRGGWRRGLWYVLPVGLLGLAMELLLGRTPAAAALGRLAGAGGPVGGLALVLTLAQVAALTVGALVLVGFLSVRGRDAYPSSPTTPVTAVVRTLGLAATAAAVVLGALRAVTGGSITIIALHAVALAAVLLLTDRLLPAGLVPPRTVIVTPALVVLLGHLTATGGVIFGDLGSGLYATALALGATIATAALAQTRAGAWGALPLLAAVHWWPTCLSPLTIAGGLC